MIGPPQKPRGLRPRRLRRRRPRIGRWGSTIRARRNVLERGRRRGGLRDLDPRLPPPRHLRDATTFAVALTQITVSCLPHPVVVASLLQFYVNLTMPCPRKTTDISIKRPRPAEPSAFRRSITLETLSRRPPRVDSNSLDADRSMLRGQITPDCKARRGSPPSTPDRPRPPPAAIRSGATSALSSWIPADCGWRRPTPSMEPGPPGNSSRRSPGRTIGEGTRCSRSTGIRARSWAARRE